MSLPPVRAALTALLLACCGRAHAAGPGLPSVASFFRDPETVSAKLSSNGGYVAVLSNLTDGRQALTVRNTADLKQFNIVSVGSGTSKIVEMRWLNEQRLELTVKNLGKEFGSSLDEFAIDRDGANLVHLISGDWEHSPPQPGGAGKERLLTADYTYFGGLHDGSDDIIVEKNSYNSIDPYPDQSRLYRLNTRTQQLSPLQDGAQPDQSRHWLVDLNNVPRIVSTHQRGRCAIAHRAPGSAQWRELDNADCFQTAFTPRFLDGDDKLYVNAQHQGSGALFLYDLQSGQLAREPLVSVPGFDLAGEPEFDYRARKVLGVHLLTDARTTVWFDRRLQAIQRRVDDVLGETTNELHCADNCAVSPVLLVSATSDRQPPQYFLYAPASNTMSGLGGAYPEIRPAQMGQRDFHRYRARDGMAIPAYVTLPAGKGRGPLPTVVLVHGGPHARGASWEWEGEAQFLASRGYVVIQPEFRGSTGFGLAHFQAGWKQWGGAMQDDLADAASWAIKQGWSDPRRIAIMGASYGGYATLMGLIKNPELFRCGVDWAGVSDLRLMFNTGDDDATEDALRYGMPRLIGDPHAAADAAMFAAASPLLRAAQLTQPLLIAHGAQDRRVPLAHATQLRDAIGARNAQLEWVLYPNEGHGWRHEDDRIDFWTRVDAFLAKHLAAGAATTRPAP